jgi:rhomboid protease GluP
MAGYSSRPVRPGGRQQDPDPAVAPEQSAFMSLLGRRKAIVVLVILGLNLLAFLALELLGGSHSRLNLVRFGAKVNELIAAGEYWRLATSVFLHLGFAHLLFNGLALWTFGSDLEKLYGPGRFAVIYLVSGIAGSYASYQFSPAISVGASGAVFGLIGASLAFGLRNRSAIPVRVRSRFGTGVLPALLYNLLYGLRPGSMIDNYAHIGGLLAGVVLALIIPPDLDALADQFSG